jgi:hypothetical protein
LQATVNVDPAYNGMDLRVVRDVIGLAGFGTSLRERRPVLFADAEFAIVCWLRKVAKRKLSLPLGMVAEQALLNLVHQT